MGGDSISRRRFLEGAVGVGAGAIGFPYVILPSALGKGGGIAASNRITMGCIGMGGQGTYVMKAFLDKNEVQVLAVCDVNRQSGGYLGSAWGGWSEGEAGYEPARRIVEEKYSKQKQSGVYKGCDTYTDFRDVLARDDIDTVLIGTPDHWHGIMGVMSARAGKDVYCEKPLAYSISEGRAICDAVKKHGIVWQTGSQQRSDRNFRFACELVRNGRIGKVHTIKVTLPDKHSIHNKEEADLRKVRPVPKGFDYDMWLGPAPWAAYSRGRCHFNFRWVSDYSGGQITDWAGHHCDIAQWAMGTELTSPVEVEGTGVFRRDSLYDTVEDYGFVCKYAEGFTLEVRGEETHGVRFEGDKGWIFVNRKQLKAEPESVLESVIGPDEVRLYKSEDHKQNFIDCVKSRSQTAAPAEIAHRSIMIGHLGVIAIKLGRKLRWEPVKERFINDNKANRFLSRPMRSPWRL